MNIFLVRFVPWHPWARSVLLIGMALGVLLLFLTACQSMRADVIDPPTRITVVDLHDPWQINGTTMSILHPNGLLYVINSASIAVIDNIEVSAVITIPGPSGKIIDPRAPDYAEVWGNYPTLSYVAFNEKTGHVHVLVQRSVNFATIEQMK